MARINPIRTISSHPSKIQALVVLFDEFGFDSVQEIAIGTIPGESGSDVLPWRQFDATQIDTPPDMAGNVLNLFSFSRVSLCYKSRTWYENLIEQGSRTYGSEVVWRVSFGNTLSFVQCQIFRRSLV